MNFLVYTGILDIRKEKQIQLVYRYQKKTVGNVCADNQRLWRLNNRKLCSYFVKIPETWLATCFNNKAGCLLLLHIANVTHVFSSLSTSMVVDRQHGKKSHPWIHHVRSNSFQFRNKNASSGRNWWNSPIKLLNDGLIVRKLLKPCMTFLFRDTYKKKVFLVFFF